MTNQNFHWTIETTPATNQKLRRQVELMNKFGVLPWPGSRFAEIAKKKIILLLKDVKGLQFNYGFSIFYGNISGKDIFLSNSYILDYAPVIFGEQVIVGPDVKFITSTHELNNFNIVTAKEITIEDNVWLSMNIIVLPGVTIGKNSVIGAGSIVSKSIPSNVLAAGNPAKVIKTINRDYKWWNDLKNK